MNYNIEGEPLPVVICNLEANETMITKKGAMSWMTPNMKMETTSNGGIGKCFLPVHFQVRVCSEIATHLWVVRE